MVEGRARVGRAWSEDDDGDLRRRIAARQPAGVIAKGMDRTVDAIRGRAAALHVALPSSQRPWRHFPSRTTQPLSDDVPPSAASGQELERDR